MYDEQNLNIQESQIDSVEFEGNLAMLKLSGKRTPLTPYTNDVSQVLPYSLLKMFLTFVVDAEQKNNIESPYHPLLSTDK